jgi:hypothetical protein
MRSEPISSTARPVPYDWVPVGKPNWESTATIRPTQANAAAGVGTLENQQLMAQGRKLMLQSGASSETIPQRRKVSRVGAFAECPSG